MPGPVQLANLPPPPPTLPVWAKVLWYIAETAAVGASYLAFDNGQEIRPVGVNPGDPDPNSWRHFQFVFKNTTSQDAADDQVFTMDIANYTNGSIDSSWTDADYTTVKGTLDTLIATIVSRTSSYLTLQEVRSYVRAFNPYSLTAKPFADSGPPEMIWTYNLPGGGTSTIAPQICSTITELTPVRAHWGRHYLPTCGAGSVSVGGRLATTIVDELATAHNQAYAALMAQNFQPVVATTRSDKANVRTLQHVTGIKVDDILDVQRRRRYRHFSHVSTQP